MSTTNLKACIQEDVRVMEIVLEALKFANQFPQMQTILIRRITNAKEAAK